MHKLAHIFPAKKCICQQLWLYLSGVPDERAGELPRAYIVSKSSKPSEESIHKYLETKVSPNKKLKGGVEFVQAIPKAASGKILRRELKKDYLSKHAKWYLQEKL